MSARRYNLQGRRWAVSLTRVPRKLTRNLWVVPILGALLISVVGLWVRSRVEGSMKSELTSRLQTVLNADVEALRLWFSEKELDAKALAHDIRIRDAAIHLSELEQQQTRAPHLLANDPAARVLQTYLTPLLENQRYLDFVLISRNKRILASPYRPFVGRTAPSAYDIFLDKALAGDLAVSRPFAREVAQDQPPEGPTMFVAAPVYSTNRTVIAALALRLKPEQEFSRIFTVARMGESGETYAFDRRGVMLTASRFDKQLRMQGLIPNVAGATAILNLRLVDPTANPTRAGPGQSSRDITLTRMAAAATRGIDGCDVNGYSNYRGVQVIGAWAWLPEFEMGVATEVAAEEAFHTVNMTRQAFIVLFVLLVLSGMALFAFTMFVDRLQASIRRDTLASRRLGQYVLLEEIGRGANGMVYRAQHSLLRRPVAIKLLSPELTDDQSTARFEQEVQMTSQLTHPNTVAVYDYGRTPEGLFYYAMEFLSGIDLDRLVRQFGPQPEARVIHILRQACGSLAEAHRIGLIHRDIKPANIVLTRRGGICDLVKVLDFGLVKAAHHDARESKVVGTPHFMPPEAIEQPSAAGVHSDLYSLGAVGYWLLTGTTLFDESNVPRLLENHTRLEPVPPSQRLKRPLSPDLERVILACLAKDPSNRPLTAEALDHALGECKPPTPWTAETAQAWWQTHLHEFERTASAAMPHKTLVIAPRPPA